MSLSYLERLWGAVETMKFIAVTALVASVFFNQGMGAAVDAGGEIQALAARQSHPVAFNVAVAGKGTNLSSPECSAD